MRAFYVLPLLGIAAVCASPNRATTETATADTAIAPTPVEPTEGAAGPSERITLAVGDTFSMALPSNASTGFRWSVDIPPILEQESGVYTTPPNETPRPGMGGTMRFRFRAVAEGRGSLQFAYSRPGAETTPVSRAQYEITVIE